MYLTSMNCFFIGFLILFSVGFGLWLIDKKLKLNQKNREQYFLNSIIKQKANNKN